MNLDPLHPGTISFIIWLSCALRFLTCSTFLVSSPRAGVSLGSSAALSFNSGAIDFDLYEKSPTQKSGPL